MKAWQRHCGSLAVFVGFGVLALGSVDNKSTASKTDNKADQTAEDKGKQAGAEPAKAPAAPKIDVKVTSEKLFTDYQANEVSADEVYKNKSLLVTGKVASVTKDFLDNIVVSLTTSNQFMSVMATVDDSEKAKAGKLAKGETVSVLCKGGGAIVGSPMLGDCKIQ